MKLFGVDFNKRYVIFKVDDVDMTVAFNESFAKGIHSVDVYIDCKPVHIEVRNTYPGFVKRIREAVPLIQGELKYAINRISKRKVGRKDSA